MKLELNGFGTIEITDATLVNGGNILINAEDHFEKLKETTEYEITEVFLTETEYGWGLVAFLKLQEDEWYEDDAIVLDVENPDEVQRLKARL